MRLGEAKVHPDWDHEESRHGDVLLLPGLYVYGAEIVEQHPYGKTHYFQLATSVSADIN